jgi:PPOX class probable F420-dependent enzyme
LSGRPSATGSSYQQEADDGYFAPLAPARYMLLTTFKPDGIPVSTVVHGVVDGHRAYFGSGGLLRVWRQPGTVKRLRHTGGVQVVPCAVLGFVSFGPPLDAVAQLLPGEKASRVAGKLARKYPVQQRFLISPLHRMRRWQMVYYELLA